MRRLAAALTLLLAAAGCSLDLEGAACQTPGDRSACPDGQACGTDLTCSKRAAACTPTVDPAGATVGTACRFAAIQDALAAAQALGRKEVLLGGVTGQTYGDDAADRTGIAIPDGMTLRGDDSPPAPAGRVVLASGGGEGVRLGLGSALRGVTVRRAATGPTVGVRVTGASPAGAPSLDSVAVDAEGAGGPFEIGVTVEGKDAATLAAVTIQGATAAGLEVAREDGDQAVSLAGGLLKGNAIGVRLRRGSLTLDGTGVYSSVGQGILAAPASGEVARLTVRNGTVARGGSVGLEVQNIAALDVELTQICGNAGRSQTVAGVTRTAGGFLALGDVASPATLKANRLFGNGGDQVVIGGSGSAWSLDASSCEGTGAAAPNVLAGYALPGVGLAAIGASVSATYLSWLTDSLPRDGVDYLKGASGTVSITGLSYCAKLVPAPVCPAAP